MQVRVMTLACVRRCEEKGDCCESVSTTSQVVEGRQAWAGCFRVQLTLGKGGKGIRGMLGALTNGSKICGSRPDQGDR